MTLSIVVLLAFVVLVAVAVAMRAVVIVPQHQTAVVERLGRYRRTLPPGLGLIAPIVDRVSARLDTRPQRLVTPSAQLETADRRLVSAHAEVQYTITDPYAAVYALADLASGLSELSGVTLRNLVADLDQPAAVSSTEDTRRTLLEVLDEAAPQWGVEILDARVAVEALG